MPASRPTSWSNACGGVGRDPGGRSRAVEQDFFALVHSLLATELIARLTERLGLEIQLKRLCSRRRPCASSRRRSDALTPMRAGRRLAVSRTNGRTNGGRSRRSIRRRAAAVGCADPALVPERARTGERGLNISARYACGALDREVLERSLARSCSGTKRCGPVRGRGDRCIQRIDERGPP